jgi:hypothetical protein
VIIYAVHGTWPYGPPSWRGRRRSRADWASADAPWSEPGSAFAAAVTQGRDVSWVPFEWTGDNTFAARDTASRELCERLQASLAASDLPLAIVAHSHGGTVAVAAVEKLSAEHRARIVGVVTMGTPFATLKYGVSSALATVQALLESAATASPFVLILSAAAVWALGSSHFFIHTIALAALAWLVTLIVVALRLPARIARRSGPRAASFDLFAKAHAIDVPLVALRASGDEAGLVIAAAQALRVVAVAALGILPAWMSGDDPRASSEKSSRAKVAFALSIVVALLPLTLRYWGALTGAARLDVGGIALAIGAVVVAWIEAAGWLAVIALFGVMVLSWLATASARVLARATGPESLDLIARVECEPVPAGARAVVETLAFEDAEERRLVDGGALRHSFHELPSARRRVAEVLADWMAPAQDERRALNAGGRARALVFARWLEVHEDELRSGGPAARQTAQRLVKQAHDAAGPVAAFQMLQQMATRLPETDRPMLNGIAIDLRYAAIAVDIQDVGRKLAEI